MKQSSERADVNRSAILAYIGAEGPMTRAELARRLGVSPAVVTQLSKQLLTDGLVVELETTGSTGGRPGRLLGLVADAGSAIGVKVAADHLTAVEAGIDGTVLRSATEPFDASAPMALTDLVATLRRFIDGAGERTILGLGVGAPGSVDEQGTGTVNSTQMGWQFVPVGETLRRELGLPVLVENNVNALAVAELLHGQARGHDNALVVTIGTGVGAGIVIGGRVVRGASGVAGEIGHIPTVEDGPECQCGARGCLEAVVGQAALVAEARARGIISATAGIDVLRSRADAGDAAAEKVFSRAGHLLGRAVAGLVNTLDPELVIVLGEGVEAWPHWSFGFEPAFRAGLIARKRGISVAVETWQDDSWALGAASLVLATSFDAYGDTGEQGRLVRQRLTESAVAVEEGTA